MGTLLLAKAKRSKNFNADMTEFSLVIATTKPKLPPPLILRQTKKIKQLSAKIALLFFAVWIRA